MLGALATLRHLINCRVIITTAAPNQVQTLVEHQSTMQFQQKRWPHGVTVACFLVSRHNEHFRLALVARSSRSVPASLHRKVKVEFRCPISQQIPFNIQQCTPSTKNRQRRTNAPLHQEATINAPPYSSCTFYYVCVCMHFVWCKWILCNV